MFLRASVVRFCPKKKQNKEKQWSTGDILTTALHVEGNLFTEHVC